MEDSIYIWLSIATLISLQGVQSYYLRSAELLFMGPSVETIPTEITSRIE